MYSDSISLIVRVSNPSNIPIPWSACTAGLPGVSCPISSSARSRAIGERWVADGFRVVAVYAGKRAARIFSGSLISGAEELGITVGIFVSASESGIVSIGKASGGIRMEDIDVDLRS